jgi:hypothetical protein
MHDECGWSLQGKSDPVIIRRDLSQERGAIAVEFALILPLLILILGALLIFGFRVVYEALANNEVRSAARTASIRTGFASRAPYPSESDICANVNLVLPGSVLLDCDVDSLSSGSPPGTGDVVEVTLVYELTSLAPLSGFVGRWVDFEMIEVRASVMRE